MLPSSTSTPVSLKPRQGLGARAASPHHRARSYPAAGLAIASAMLLPGCASAPPAAAGVPAPLSGRLLVKVAAQGEQPAQSHSAAFELSGDEQAGQMRLIGPLGAQVAQAKAALGRANVALA